MARNPMSKASTAPATSSSVMGRNVSMDRSCHVAVGPPTMPGRVPFAMARAPSSPRVLAVARGDAPADLLLRGGRVLSPSTREWVTTDLAIAEGVVAGWGRRDALVEVDLAGAAVTAGFVDAHMHL